MSAMTTKALVLAAGRGKRLRPYTDAIPKPLLPVGTHRLFDWQIAGLKRVGITDLVMNTAHLADRFESLPDELAEFGVSLQLSREGDREEDALESLGGIVKALPLLTDGVEPFVVVAGDVVHEYPFERLLSHRQALIEGDKDVHLVAVPNPSYHSRGDMTVMPDASVQPGSGPHTYACLMLASPRIFVDLKPERATLFPWLWQFARSGRMTAEVYEGFWANVGDPEQYAALCSDVSRHWAATYRKEDEK